jgi:hypothetical protein
MPFLRVESRVGFFSFLWYFHHLIVFAHSILEKYCSQSILSSSLRRLLTGSSISALRMDLRVFFFNYINFWNLFPLNYFLVEVSSVFFNQRTLPHLWTTHLISHLVSLVDPQEVRGFGLVFIGLPWPFLTITSWLPLLFEGFLVWWKLSVWISHGFATQYLILESVFFFLHIHHLGPKRLPLIPSYLSSYRTQILLPTCCYKGISSCVSSPSNHEFTKAQSYSFQYFQYHIQPLTLKTIFCKPK